MTSPRRDISPDTLQRLTVAAEPWLSCDDCFEQVDLYVELLLDGETDTLPGLRAHLTACAACAEEARSLLVLAAADAGLDPEEALRRLG
ncbi:hypothetical protein GCM10027449_06200 [Sinomonas notoginsengisoli]|uniref:hypothetical protein n=1 Tax=Sinomonas notoginsengisoli TaxID=1457311 RepID=UPI001F370992|nr:hypothetical protein [Sinomonas notoginsengisoli]